HATRISYKKLEGVFGIVGGFHKGAAMVAEGHVVAPVIVLVDEDIVVERFRLLHEILVGEGRFLNRVYGPHSGSKNNRDGYDHDEGKRALFLGVGGHKNQLLNEHHG